MQSVEDSGAEAETLEQLEVEAEQRRKEPPLRHLRAVAESAGDVELEKRLLEAPNSDRTPKTPICK